MVNLTVEKAWEFDDHKGWDILLGARKEGQISWFGEGHEMVKDGSIEPGWCFCGYVPNEEISGRGYGDFQETLNAFSLAIFGVEPAKALIAEHKEGKG